MDTGQVCNESTEVLVWNVSRHFSSQTRVGIPRVVIPLVVMYIKDLQRIRDESKRVAMPNLFAVYSILIDAHVEYVFFLDSPMIDYILYVCFCISLAMPTLVPSVVLFLVACWLRVHILLLLLFVVHIFIIMMVSLHKNRCWKLTCKIIPRQLPSSCCPPAYAASGVYYQFYKTEWKAEVTEWKAEVNVNSGFIQLSINLFMRSQRLWENFHTCCNICVTLYTRGDHQCLFLAA